MSSTSSPRVVLVCASQEPPNYFHRATLLGRSLKFFPDPLRPKLFLLPNNKGAAAMGLSQFYNHAIAEISNADIIAFIHDDVFIHDWCIGFHLQEALKAFDLVGVVGSSGISYGQPGWWHDLDEAGKPARNNKAIVSGSINHFDPVQVCPDYFGVAPLSCDLLDGAFMASRLSKLQESGLRFDERFHFHCYDTDFCYSAKALGFTIGTWPLSITHGSPGNFGTDWIKAAKELKCKLLPKQES